MGWYRGLAKLMRRLTAHRLWSKATLPENVALTHDSVQSHVLVSHNRRFLRQTAQLRENWRAPQGQAQHEWLSYLKTHVTIKISFSFR